MKMQLKAITLLSTFGLISALEFSSIKEAFAQSSSSLFVTSGYIFLKNNQLTIESNEGLSIGRKWSVFDLKRGSYIGQAIVTSNFPAVSNCRSTEEGILHQRQSTLQMMKNAKIANNAVEVILLRSTSQNLKSINLRKISFQTLPVSIKSHLSRLNPRIFIRLEEGSYRTVDGDGIPDIVIARISMIHGNRSTVFMRTDSDWIVKHQYDCESK